VIRVLIADDERLARSGLRRQLGLVPELRIAGETADGASTVRAIRELRPDLVFLDVQMPGGDGFEVIRAVGPASMPAVVFVTAHDEHAIRAFEADAVDYLLKPVDPERLAAAVSRALRRVRAGPAAELVARLETLLSRVAGDAPPAPDRIAVEVEGRYRFLEPTEIDWVEARGNYVALHAGGRSHRLRATLDAMERRLGGRFLRVGRSMLVNRDAIEAAEHFVKGSWVLFLRGGTRVRTSRHYRSRLDPLLGPAARGA
jgi:two-component system LytT family response regulator